MFDKNMFGLLLDSDKTTCDLGEFIHKFYVKVNYYKLESEENEFDNILTCLYNLDDKEYKKWLKELRKMPYAFVRENLSLMETITKNNDFENLVTAFDMYKKTLSLAARALPVKANYNDVTENKEMLLKELKRTLLSIRDNKPNNPVENAQEEFERFYKDISENEVLGSFYNKLYNGLDDILINRIKEEIKKVNGQALKYATANINFHTKRPMYNRKF